MRKRRVITVTILGFIAVLVAGAVIYYKWRFPYGRSHCCLIAMQAALRIYADDHGGRFPAGESSPEASLSLLYQSKQPGLEANYIGDGYILRGMTVPEETVQQILVGGGLLGPDTCGWHYVEGLTRADDGRIALLWPKVALGHDGQRMRDGGREVLFVSQWIEWIPGDKWEAFLEEQKELLSQRSEKPAAKIRTNE